MLDDGHGVAVIHQLLEYVDQALDVGHVKPGGGFVEHIKGVAVGFFDQLLGQFDSLGFTTGQGRAGLAQAQVTQTDVADKLHGAPDGGDGRKKARRLGEGHLEDFGNILAAVLNRQGFVVETFAPADITEHVDVGQKTHFHFGAALALAGFAAAGGDVERETSGRVPPGAGRGGQSEKFADFR